MARILVADDEEGLRSFMCEALEDEGHEVQAAPDGVQALKALRSSHFHLLVTDLKMPNMDGMTLLHTIHAEQPELEVIVLTAHGTVAQAVEAMRTGAFDFLEKPMPSPTALRLVVSRALERQRLQTALENRAATDAPQLAFASPAMQKVQDILTRVAPTDANILLMGDSGVGKEIAAQFVHTHSRRASGPFVAVNCAALSPQLLESELFGHEKGAFTGATARRRGRIELAEGGTFFLDEIGELHLDLQAKLLRILQERVFERVGGHQTVHADVRWLAATNRDLLQEVDAGRFREDLYHRLAVFPVRLPPLSERPEDIGPLAQVLLTRLGAQLGRPELQLTAQAERSLGQRDFRGNVRELSNLLERAAILSPSDDIDVVDLDPLPGLSPAPAPAPAKSSVGPTTLDALERMAIEEALVRTEGRRKEAAEQLGISVRTLYDRIKKHGLT